MGTRKLMFNRQFSDNAAAILWVTAGTALFTLVFASGKFASGSASPLQILFLRYVGGLVTLAVVVWRFGGSFRSYKSDKPSMHLVRAFLGSYGGVAAIYAAANMPIVDATAIGLLQAVFTVVLGIMIFGDRITKPHWIGIVLCCGGAAIVVGSKGAFRSIEFIYLVPASAAFLGAILIAFESIMIKKLATSEKTMTVLLYVNAFGILLLAVPAVLTWRSTDVVANLPFVFLGPLAITAQYFVIKGYRMADVSLLGPVDYTWIVFAGIVGYFYFGETPTTGVVAGSAVIVGGGVILAFVKSPRRDVSPAADVVLNPCAAAARH